MPKWKNSLRAVMYGSSKKDRFAPALVITAKAAGNGDTSVGGVITFDPLKQMQRPGLLKVGNQIVIGFAMTALLLVIILASRGMTGTDHVDGTEP